MMQDAIETALDDLGPSEAASKIARFMCQKYGVMLALVFGEAVIANVQAIHKGVK